MSTYEHSIGVPDQLQPYLTDEVLAVHSEWQQADLKKVADHMDAAGVEESQYGRAVVLNPKGEHDESRTLVLALPHQQAWKPSMAIRAEVTRQMVAPDSRMVVLPNNTFSDKYYSFSNEQRAQLESGDMTPLFERHVRMVESLGVKGSIDATGFSLGALSVLGMARHGSDEFSVRVANVDEAPNSPRSPKQLQADFLASGGWGKQRAAIADADIPVLGQALSMSKLGLDYGRFGLSTFNPDNKALHLAMAGQNTNHLVAEAVARHPEIAVKIGYVVGSRVFDAETLDLTDVTTEYPERIAAVAYDGEHARAHTTGDNVVAHALMFRQAVELAGSPKR